MKGTCQDCKAVTKIVSKGRCRTCSKKRKISVHEQARMLSGFMAPYKGDVFIETGTFGGRGVLAAQMLGFKQIYSVELYRPVYLIAKRNIGRHANIHLSLGESGQWLGETISKVSSRERITFWLDAHYSGKGTVKFQREISPLHRELAAILAAKRPPHDIILIDDVRHMPSFKYTLETLTADLKKINPNFKVKVESGRVVAVP